MMAVLGGCVSPIVAPMDSIEQLSAAQPQLVLPPPSAVAIDQRPALSKSVAGLEMPGAIPDQILVTGQSYSGYWVVEGPADIDFDIGLFSGIQISYGPVLKDRNICLIHDRQGDLSALCSAGTVQAAQGSGDGVAMRLLWWAGPGTLKFDGRPITTDQIDGALTGGLLGQSLTGRIPARLRRIKPGGEEISSPHLAVLAIVLGDLGRGVPRPGLYAAKGLARFQDQLREGLALPDDPEIRFLGTVYNRWRPKQPESAQDVFRIEAKGRIGLCRIEVETTGQVRDLDCRLVPL